MTTCGKLPGTLALLDVLSPVRHEARWILKGEIGTSDPAQKCAERILAILVELYN